MTDTKSVKVLKKEEVEKGNHETVVELPFVPIVDEEAESTTQDVTVKLLSISTIRFFSLLNEFKRSKRVWKRLIFWNRPNF